MNIASRPGASRPGGLSKVPEVTLVFWIIKIAATTLGETGGDSVTMTLHWGYLAGTALFVAVLMLLVVAQIIASRFYPWLYWATIVASTTFTGDSIDDVHRALEPDPVGVSLAGVFADKSSQCALPVSGFRGSAANDSTMT